MVELIVDFPAPLLSEQQIIFIVGKTLNKLDKATVKHFGEPMNPRTFHALKVYLTDFFGDLRPHLRLTQKDLDNRAKIALENFFTDIETKKDAEKFWLAVCSFNNSLEKVFRDI